MREQITVKVRFLFLPRFESAIFGMLAPPVLFLILRLLCVPVSVKRSASMGEAFSRDPRRLQAGDEYGSGRRTERSR